MLEAKTTLMSRNLTQMIYDAASFFNVSIDTAATKFQSGIAGELEPLKKMGLCTGSSNIKADGFESWHTR